MKQKSKRPVRFFALSMAVLLIASIFIWGFQTSWGKIEIRRLQLVGEDGTKISTLIYIPENATAETPAPCAVIFHGRSNQGHSNDTWSMELARRGYVVLSPDLTGGGESDVMGGGTDATKRATQGRIVAEYALTMDIVDPEQLNIIGYSLGTATTTLVAAQMPEYVNSCLNVMGPFMIRRNMDTVYSLMADYDIDVGIVKADCDQYDFNFIGDAQACRESVSQALGLTETIAANSVTPMGETSSLYYMEVNGAMHQTGNISGETINAIIQFENTMNDAPIKLEDSDQAWLPQQLFSGVACVTMMFALAAFIDLLMQTEFFRTMSFARVPRKEQRGAKAWVLDILFTLIIPIILFIPVSTWGMSWFAKSKILTSTNLNGIMLWLLVAMFAIGTVRTLIKANVRKKAGETLSAADYCLAPAGEKFNWANVGKSFLMALIVVSFFGLWMTAMEGFMGIDYQVWNLSTYLKPSPARIIKAIPYMIIIFIVMFSGNINQRVLPSTGNERKDTWIAVAVNTVLTASALFLLLFIQYGGSLMIGTGEVPFKQNGGSTGALDFAFGYCYMMGGTTGVVTYIYRKHGNVLPAVFTCAMFAGLFTLASMTLVR
jgi:hypothetical protein